MGVLGTGRIGSEVARILAGFLAAAGAEVHLTRDGDFAVTEVERVQGSETFNADRYLRIGHRLRRFGYFYSSAAGRQWAQGAASAFTMLKLPAPAFGEEALYALQQTSCPSMYASWARVDSTADEGTLLAPGALRAEAYALFVSLVREFTEHRRAWPVDSLEVRDADGRPVAGAVVTLGDALTLETDRAGRAHFALLEPGAIEAVVEDRRVRARRVLLDSSRGAVLTGSRGD
ncbi:MAG: carboxypeptidase regulatory-like domain-containing protein [Candidatus Eisenbacteria bacterium]|uniref:Carboxypeptidase regulatory-like domain-containing protein n=1 Tax=Eiseniibacteriota bacterium TaxID=2212470 RepID=A0A9D6QLQ6_UNCEI|nr:carboxypeptidase regulatory-like domain-containing protein [Candidatus Eisenbacteria bacterium]